MIAKLINIKDLLNKVVKNYDDKGINCIFG